MVKILIVSWNVAGWLSTSRKIRSHLDLSPEEFFEKHKIDILCLQEAKVTKQKLEVQGNQVGANLKAYESFWAVST